MQSFIEQRKALANDPHRPQYHFLPPANWMNDPHGLIQWEGQYHLFYQYNPERPYHDNIHWGHAVSDDLVHWQDYPPALAPNADQHDADGCWSGCAINNNGVPTLFYTGVYPQVQNMATSSDGLRTWQKYPGNPVIPQPPEEFGARCGGHIRDPFVWREDETWYMLLGSKIEDVGGMILLYRSDNLIDWEFLHPLMVGDIHQKEPVWMGTMWECPNLLNFGEKRVLFLSAQATPSDLMYPVYFTGSFQERHFTPEKQAILAHGGYFYAPQAMMDEYGRFLLWGWIREGRSRTISEWAGIQSLPLEMTLLADGAVCLNPASELQILRHDHQQFENIQLDAGTSQLLEGVQGDCLEIIAEFEFEPDAEMGILLRCSPDGQELTRLLVKPAQNRLLLNRELSSISFDVESDEREAPLHLTSASSVKLHIFLDRSVVEVFVENGRSYLAGRIYPQRPDSLSVGLFCNKGQATLKSIDIWQMESIWQDLTE